MKTNSLRQKLQLEKFETSGWRLRIQGRPTSGKPPPVPSRRPAGSKIRTRGKFASPFSAETGGAR